MPAKNHVGVEKVTVILG